jgi:hypothetical protein
MGLKNRQKLTKLPALTDLPAFCEGWLTKTKNFKIIKII